MNERIKQIMKALDVDEQTAREIIADDEKIDKGEKLFELTADQKQAEKKMRAVGTRTPTVYKFTKRERKADTDKREVISAITGTLEVLGAEGIEVTNPEREIVFLCHGRKLKIVLSAPRS
jgi:hypothetical protein